MKIATTMMLAVAGLMSMGISAAPVSATVTVGSKAPAFTLEDQTGKSVSLADFAGKTVVLTWFNQECPFVKAHLKAGTFTEWASKYKDKDVVFLAVDSTYNHTKDTEAKAVVENSLPFPILMDTPGTVGHLYSAKSTPETYIINKDGTLVYQGAVDNNEHGDANPKVSYVGQALDEVLAGKTVTVSETKSYGCTVHYAK